MLTTTRTRRCALLLLLASLLASLLLALAAPPASAAPAGKRRPPTAEELYDQGLRQMRRGYYTKALESFNRVRNYHRDDPISVKAQLAIADLHYKKGDFEQAKFAYEEFASLHPRHESLDYVTFRIGQSIYRRAPKFAGRDQTATKSAVNVWTGFDARFPDSQYVDDVNKLLTRGRNRLASKELHVARFYARKDSWGAVRNRAEYLLRRYPDTPQAPRARFLLGNALHAWGEVDAATEVRAAMAERNPDSKYLHRLDRVLARPAGEPPDEKIFIRPYRIRGLVPQGAGGGA
ncbi:MAG: outer membrane protein assembly factor BamD [Myxococcota bacterium]